MSELNGRNRYNYVSGCCLKKEQTTHIIINLTFTDRDPSYWKSWYGITVADINKLNSPIDFDDLLAEIEKPS